jgi:hypothetical protein
MPTDRAVHQLHVAVARAEMFLTLTSPYSLCPTENKSVYQKQEVLERTTPPTFLTLLNNKLKCL